jgi:hypothetical protein
MTFDPASLSNVLLILTAWGGAFLAALWLSLVFWTYRDIRSRAHDPLARILAVLVVAVLFIPGIVIYLILRPARTLEDEYPGRGSSSANRRRKSSLPGLWEEGERKLAGLPHLPHQVKKELPPMWETDGAPLGHVPLLRNAGAGYAP